MGLDQVWTRLEPLHACVHANYFPAHKRTSHHVQKYVDRHPCLAGGRAAFRLLDERENKPKRKVDCTIKQTNETTFNLKKIP